MARLTDFFSLQSPLLVRHNDGAVVILAFGLSARGWLARGGVPVAMILEPVGGLIQWVPIADLVFPSPIQARPAVADGPARANAGKTARVTLQ